MATTSTSDDDVVMSKDHKQVLREFRDQLVDNMYPDDILNQLQSHKILTHRDSTRIKDKGSAEAMNESLLDTLMRKPDRAFAEFINALRESDQNHVANIIDKNKESTPKEKRDQRKSRVAHDEYDSDNYASPSPTRKRKFGEIGVKVNVDDLEFDEEEDKDTINTVKRKRRTVLDFQDLDEEQERIKKKLDIKLLKVISKEVDNLDRIVSSGISQTSMSMRRVALETIKELQKHRREITSVDFGSVIFRIVCVSLEGLEDLRMLCNSGRLAAMIERILTRAILRQYNLRHAKVAVRIDPSEYKTCQQELLTLSKTSQEDVENENPKSSLNHIKNAKSEKITGIKEGFSTWPASSWYDELDLVTSLSLRSPPHVPSDFDDITVSKLMCRKSAEETLQVLGMTEQIQLISGKSTKAESLLRLSSEQYGVESRGRSPVRRRHVRHIKERLKPPKKSLSLSPMPVSRRTMADLKSSASDKKAVSASIHFRSQTSPTRLSSPIRH